MVAAKRPKTLPEILKEEGFTRRFNSRGRCPRGMCPVVWQVAKGLRKEIGIDPGDVHLNGGSRIALKTSERTAVIIERRGGVTSSTLVPGRLTEIAVLDETARGLIEVFAYERAEVFQASFVGRPAVAVAVDEEDMLVVQQMSLS